MTDSTFCQVTTRAQQGAAAHSVRENGQCPLCTWRHLKAPQAKFLGPTLPLTSALTSAHHSTHCTAFSSCLRASCELTPMLGQPPRALPKGPGGAKLGIGDGQAPVPDSPRCHAATWANWGATAYSVREKGQGTASTGQHSKTPHAKTRGPTLPLRSVLISACHSAGTTAVSSHLRASWGITLTLRWPPRGPS